MSDLDFAADIKLLPHAMEEEACVLGAILMEPDESFQRCEGLQPEMFYSNLHRKLYGMMIKLHSQNSPVDLLSFSTYLTGIGQLSEVGGRAMLTDLCKRAFSTIFVDGWVQTIKEKYARRQLIKTLNDSLKIAYDLDVPITEATEQCQRKVLELSSSNSTSGLVHISEAMASLYQEKYEIQVGLKPAPVKTGFYDLDNRIGGLHKKNLIILAGRPSMGKTAYGMAIAWHVAGVLRENTFVFSLETSKEELAARLAAKITRIHMGQFFNNQITEPEWIQFHDFTKAEIIHNSKLFIDDNFNISPSQIRNNVRQTIAKTGERAGLIMIDHLSLLAKNDKSGNTDLRIKVGNASRMLKQLAGEFDCPVLALSQLNRSTEGRADKRPAMSDLSESGNIEQDADVIMMLYRDEYYNKETVDVGIAEIITAKGRNVETGVDKLLFEGQFMDFKNLAKPNY